MADKTKNTDAIIGICGLGVVGSAIEQILRKKHVRLTLYDKYKNNGIGCFDDLLKSDILFLALPTLFSDKTKEYDKSAIHDIMNLLQKNKYSGVVVLKSTVEPGTTRRLYEKYKLNLVHNPEFLTARTAADDFDSQNHIVLGGSSSADRNLKVVSAFYAKYWPTVLRSLCSWEESELMKISVNCFYSVKIQFFNELFKLSETFGDSVSYKKMVGMMLRNGWICPQHTSVPGPDGKFSYGGMCFPKDTNALCELMRRRNSPCQVLAATIKERNEMRDDTSKKY